MCTAVGNPIDVITGNKFQRDTDLPALPGQMGLEIVRNYNSGLSGLQHNAGLLGRGWRLSYEINLKVLGDTIQILEGDGTRRIFSRDPLQPSLCSSADPSNGEIDIRHLPSGDEYIWRKTDGNRLTFNRYGLLVQILAPNGRFLTLQHDHRGWLVKVTDPQGRSMTLNYLDSKNAKHRPDFKGVQSIDTPVGRFTYRYGNESSPGSSLEDQRQLVANLVQVQMPDGEQRKYHHEDSRFPTLLTGISVSDDAADDKRRLRRFATFAYDSNARAVLTTHANNADRVSLDTSQPGKTILTNSLGQKTVYQYGLVAGELRLVDIRGAGCSLCGDVNVRYGYDDFGRIKDVTRLSDSGQAVESTLRTFDYYGRPTSLRRVVYHNGRPGQPELLQRYTYGVGAGANPILIVEPSVVPGHGRVTAIEYGKTDQSATAPLQVTQIGFTPDVTGRAEHRQIRRVIRFAYDAKGQRIEIDGPMRNAENAAPGNSDISRFEYDERNGLVRKMLAPDGSSSEVMDRDAALRPTRIRSSDGYAVQVANIQYNWRGQPETIVLEAVLLAGDNTPLTKIVRYRYGGQGKLQSITRGDGTVIRFTYDGAGRLVRHHLPDGSVAEQIQDTEGRTEIRARYTPEGDRAGTALTRQSYMYDENGRLKTVDDNIGLVQHVEYTSLGQIAKLSDAAGVATKLEYDENGLLSAREMAAGTVDAATVRFARDINGHVVSVTDTKGVNTQRRYDDFGRLVSEYNPERGATVFRYDDSGVHVGRTDESGAVTIFTYDHAGRLIATGSPKRAGLVRYGYQGSRLVETSAFSDDAASVIQERNYFSYNAFGQLVSDQRWIASTGNKPLSGPAPVGLSFSRRYIYDTDGRLVQQLLPDGHRLTYRYAANGLQNEILLDEQVVVGDIRQSYAAGIAAYTYGNGIRHSVSVDARGRVAQIESHRTDERPGESWLARHGRKLFTSPWVNALVYRQKNRYDSRDLLIATERVSSRGHTEEFGYDALQRLTSAKTGEGGGRRFTYDAAGNRLSEQVIPEPTHTEQSGASRKNYQYSGNRLLAVLGDGNKIEQASLFHATGVPLLQLAGKPDGTLHTYRTVYDSARRPRARYEGNRLLVSYTYNLNGERIARTVFDDKKATTTYYLYEGGKLSAEANDKGQITRHYIYLNGLPVAQAEMHSESSLLRRWWRRALALFSQVDGAADGTAELNFIHGDHLGVPRLITDTTQAVVWQGKTDVFGKVHTELASGSDTKLRFPGQLADEETGLHYNYLREYDPATGRYTTVDPIGIDGGLNPFVYAANNPLGLTDRFGLYEQDIHYYMTYFLAVAAGLSAPDAYVLASATQYIDDNELTKPVDIEVNGHEGNYLTDMFNNYVQLKRYHFVLSNPETGRVKEEYDNSDLISSLDKNEQLRNLKDAADWNAKCAKLQLYGEFLHAFQDTFSHRHPGNTPISAIANLGPLKFGIGHGYWLHKPDKTFNNWPFVNNESRTLEMERQVYLKLQELTPHNGTAVPWEQLKPFLEKFNALPENEKTNDPPRQSFEKKIRQLDERLSSWELAKIIPYDVGKAADFRLKALCSLLDEPAEKYAALILPNPETCY